MDEKTQKERLEQELRFLKESFEAEVISKEELEKGEERIEVKLKEIASGKKNPEEKTEETNEKLKDEETKEEAGSKDQDQSKKTVKEEQKEVSYNKNYGNYFKYAIIFIILILVIVFSYSIFNQKNEAKIPKEEILFTPACSSNDNCKQEGMEGICSNPGTKDAKCEFMEIVKINVLVLNDRKNCFNCDTKRVISIFEDWFGHVNAKEIDYNSDEGKKLAEKFDAKLLPTYTLDENITKKPIFAQSKQIFINKSGIYMLSEDASGSSFYFRRQNIPKKLDLFIKTGDSKSDQAEKNLKEFLDAFKDVQFEKHLPGNLTKELGIKVYPTFLVNNRIKFTGAQPAEIVKENFCQLNKLQHCSLNLSKSLI